jgi:hypothetical protein
MHLQTKGIGSLEHQHSHQYMTRRTHLQHRHIIQHSWYQKRGKPLLKNGSCINYNSRNQTLKAKYWAYREGNQLQLPTTKGEDHNEGGGSESASLSIILLATVGLNLEPLPVDRAAVSATNSQLCYELCIVSNLD